ncbi:MAG TPA: cysteine desulfurase family protein [Gemmatimonadales bacterium]|jgi:cysteine desulfurase
MTPRRIYLDHAATTPVRKEVREAMLPYLGEEAFGNPSSGHHFGRQARAGLETARKQVAAALGAQQREILFTSGGTEADNQAILGCAMACCSGTDLRGAHIVASPIEHKAVLAALHEAERLGAHTTLLPVNRDGVIDLAALDALLTGTMPGGKPSIVSVMWVNNETGVLQPIGEIAARCAAAGVAFHTDAVQALGKVPLRLSDHPGISVCSISAHKIGGPKGVGAIFVRERKGVLPLLHGGGQQGGLRPGTENVPGAVAIGVAAELAAAEQPATASRLAAIRDAVEAALRQQVPDLVVHSAGAPRGPNILLVSAPGTDSEAMLMHLDVAGLACASGSACSTGAVEPSHVLSAMGVPRDLAVAAVRMSFGSLSAADQVPVIATTYGQVVAKVRELRRVLART